MRQVRGTGGRLAAARGEDRDEHRQAKRAAHVEEVEALARSAQDVADLDPWDALIRWLHGFVGYIATKQALADELFAIADQNTDVFSNCRAALHAAGQPLLERAQATGEVREDADIEDIVRMVGAIAKMPAAEPAQVERVLDLALDGLRAH